jgi:FtsP/CotA-like multicopper oxidase with cupredoxin domain
MLVARPDLFDPHSVHSHGIPENSAIFDGLPESALTINPNSTITYYHRLWEPGTYMYHCHVEALEHMAMGMMGQLFVRARQDRTAVGDTLGTWVHRLGDRYAYEDGDGSTRYDVDFPIQINSMDSVFHETHINVQPLLGFPFWRLRDDYAMFNGRGYPDTVSTAIPPGPLENGEKQSFLQNARVTATAGQKILLRISNLNVTRDYTIATTGLPMRVVGKDAKLLRGTGGRSMAFTATSLFVASGSTYDAIIDTTGVTPGRYFFYTTNLNYLSNGTEDFGGLMTEIIITN